MMNFNIGCKWFVQKYAKDIYQDDWIQIVMDARLDNNDTTILLYHTKEMYDMMRNGFNNKSK